MKLLTNKIELDYSKIDDVEIEDVVRGSHPDDWCNAFISSASYDGRDMTESELEVLNDDSQYVYEQVERWVY